MPETFAHVPTDVCAEACPVRRAASLLDGKWTLLIIRDLLSGKKRYSQLQRSLAGISPRILALRLREMEGAGIVIRSAFPTIPPTTEYELTTLGMELRHVIEALAAFGQKHMSGASVADPM